MPLDYSRVSAVKFIPPTAKKDIARWLDQTHKAPDDCTGGKLYYNGVMGSKTIFILSDMEPMPYGVAKSNGGYYSTMSDYRLIISYDGKSYDVRYEMVEAPLGQAKAIHNGKMVYCHMGYTITGVFPTPFGANDSAVLSHLLWE
jgi:hypothetical protein